MSGPVLGIDVGGTKIAALLLDGDDAIIATRQLPTDDRPLADQVIAASRAVLDGATPAGIGVAVPGQVDAETGVVRMAVNVSLPAVPLAELVRQALGVPTWVDHDSRVAAAWLLATRGGRSLAYLSVGTGISAAVALDGQVLRGASGLAGEIGHLVAVPDGPRCACGLAGCLEAVASGPAVARRAAAAAQDGTSTQLSANDGPAEVYRAAADGDLAAVEIAHDVGTHLARAIRGVVLAYGVERVVIGGGLSKAGPSFFNPILEAIEREREASALVRHALSADRIELLPPTVEAVARGAVLLVRAGLRASPSEPRRREEVGYG